jgi:DNA gyrase subunit A
VRAIDVEEDDAVVGMSITEPERRHVLAVCEKGFGKRTLLEEFRIQNRGGKGIILIDASERNGPVVDIRLVKESDEVMLITDKGQTLRTRIAEIRETGRNAQGVKIMTVEEDERVTALERVAEAPVGGSELPPEGSIPPLMSDEGAESIPPDGDKSLN